LLFISSRHKLYWMELFADFGSSVTFNSFWTVGVSLVFSDEEAKVSYAIAHCTAVDASEYLTVFQGVFFPSSSIDDESFLMDNFLFFVFEFYLCKARIRSDSDLFECILWFENELSQVTCILSCIDWWSKTIREHYLDLIQLVTTPKSQCLNLNLLGDIFELVFCWERESLLTTIVHIREKWSFLKADELDLVLHWLFLDLLL